MVHGLLPTILVGVLGALVGEVIRIVPALRLGTPPKGPEIVASVLVTLLGAGAALFGWDTPQTAYKVAVLGAAFPLLFSNAVRAAKPGSGGGGDVAAAGRSVLDYLAGRF
jgi:hypothetical protein